MFREEKLPYYVRCKGAFRRYRCLMLSSLQMWKVFFKRAENVAGSEYSVPSRLHQNLWSSSQRPQSAGSSSVDQHTGGRSRRHHVGLDPCQMEHRYAGGKVTTVNTSSIGSNTCCLNYVLIFIHFSIILLQNPLFYIILGITDLFFFKATIHSKNCKYT